MRASLAVSMVAISMAFGAVAQAGSTADEMCLAGLLKAKGKYEKCVDGWLGKLYGGKVDVDVSGVDKLSKCRIRYHQDWVKLSEPGKLPGTACDQPARYEDKLDGTMYDHLTGLTWEKKSDDGSIHDKDDTYTWSTGSSVKGNGTTYTTFLISGLNTSGFAGAKDWRMPTIAELETLLSPEECTTSPCVPSELDSGCTSGCAVTACSCTRSIDYWSTITCADSPTDAWTVHFHLGFLFNSPKNGGAAVRAVRGGL